MIDSPAQIIAILVVALLLFGPRKLPELARGLGQSVREFKRSVEGVGESFKEAASEEKAAKTEEAAQPSQGEGQKTSEPRR